MSKTSIIGLTDSGSDEAPPLEHPPTEEQRQKLFKSTERLVCRHGWWVFAEALAQVCQVGVKSYARSAPEVAASWQYRVDAVQRLAKRNPHSAQSIEKESQ